MPELVIYSITGGQIVSDELLGIGPRFLHMHPGWLPDFKGSTTIYYSILNGELPSVTGLFLDKNIDTGPILHRQIFSLPPKWMDFDNTYDSLIRSEVLCRILKKKSKLIALNKIINIIIF